MQNKRTNMAKIFRRIIWTALMILFIINNSYSQTDSLSYSTETDYYDSVVQYLTPMEYAFMMHEETNWLLKASASAYWEYGRVEGSLKLSLEKKIANGFSLNAVLFNATTINLGLSPSANAGIEFSLEPRWYYKNQKNIRDNKPTANLSGAYVAMGAGYRIAHRIYDHEIGYSNLEFMPLFAKWGVQRRFLKRGFVDVGVMAGWNKSLSGDTWSTLFFNTYVDVGMAFTRDKYKLDFDKLCPVLRCHAEDRFLLKTNLVNIINLAYVQKSLIGSIEPNIAAEFKLGSSPFSINTKLSSKFQYSKSSAFDYSVFIISPQATVEGRYYYNLHRRMLTGKTGNGLSANYISLGATYRGEFYNNMSPGYNTRQENTFVGLKAGTGIQRLISKHLYLDLSIGVGYGIQYSYDGWSGIHSNKMRGIFDFGFGIGYRF